MYLWGEHVSMCHSPVILTACISTTPSTHNPSCTQITAANSAYKYMRAGTPFLLVDGNKTSMMMQKPKANGDTRMVDAVAAAGVSG